MIAAHLEPKGLSKDTPALRCAYPLVSRADARRGSDLLRNAILRAKGHPVPRPARKIVKPRADPLPLAVKPRRLVSEIQRSVAIYFGIPAEKMVSDDRRREITGARQVAMYLSSELTKLSIAEIGRRFNRDHTTVLYAIEVVNRRAEQDDDTAYDVTLLREMLAL